MTKNDIIRKLTSRKLWLAVALFISGLIVALGGEKETAETVSGCIMQGAAVLGYLLAEGLADAAHATTELPANSVVEGVDAESMTTDQLRAVLQQMGMYPSANATREDMLAMLDAVADSV